MASNINSKYISIITEVQFLIFVFALVFGLVLYNYIDVHLHFSYIDEILAVLLLLLYFSKVIIFKSINKEFILCLIVFTGYLIYSIFLSINSFQAIIMDFLIQIKPFICFYTIYSLPIKFTKHQKKALRILSITLSFFLLSLCLIGNEHVLYFMSHYSRLATAATILGIFYFYCSNKNKNNVILMFLIISIGLFSTRYKFYAFYISFIVFFISYKIRDEFKLSLKEIIIILITTVFIIIVLFDKIEAYTITGSEEDNLWSRTALYINSISILNTYFPLGSGFATFATWASGVYYSSLYFDYNMNNIDGLTIDKYDYVADTYFPVLAQFGYIGVYLFFIFWRNRYRNALSIIKKDDKNNYNFKIAIIIIIFFIIESIADSTLTSNRGVVMMMILALYLTYKIESKEEINEDITN